MPKKPTEEKPSTEEFADRVAKKLKRPNGHAGDLGRTIKSAGLASGGSVAVLLTVVATLGEPYIERKARDAVKEDLQYHAKEHEQVSTKPELEVLRVEIRNLQRQVDALQARRERP